MRFTKERVILVDEQDDQTGVMDKMEAHEKALLHRALSIFIFNKKGEMLLQKRAVKKYHSPGLWTNACCSHPRPDENTLAAAQRRLKEELGFETPLKEIFHFTYKSAFDNGLTEHEYDHVFVGKFDGKVEPDKEEVQDYCYKSIEEIENSLLSHSAKFTAWFIIAFPKIKNWWQMNHNPG